ncbi:MAG: class I SAM-dependent methyltransferase [Proteobacteria bacterium]|nr:class I SAM-dependent methyltransferase [Pseudomonadota bacterium]
MRDTDQDWKAIGESEPWYGVLTADQFLTANLTPERIDEFYALGQTEVRRVVGVLERNFGPVSPETAVDLGCGTGRLTFAMSEFAKHVYGLDVAPGMLRRANERRQAKQILNTTFVHELPADLHLDWINSFIVLQHIPPIKGYAILEDLFRRLTPDGLVSVQLTYFHVPNHETTLHREMAAYVYDGESVRILEPATPQDVGSMSMYDYDLNKVFRLLQKHGSIQLLH